MNMSRFSKFLALAAAVLMAVACGDNARVDGQLSDAPSSEVIVKLLDVNRFEVLDTISTDAAGKFSYKVELAKGDPEFVYVFYKDTKIASLLLQAGDKVSVTADTLGNYSVEGSEESVKLAKVEADHAAATKKINAIVADMQDAEEEELAALRQQLGQEYVRYYRECVRYVMENSRSLTVVPVFFQNFGADLPVFSQSTDAIHFRNISDSLALAYPDSKYAKALKTEAERRYGYLELANRLGNAEEIGYPDIILPDVNANKVKLSEVDAKVVMIYFWSSSDAGQKMFNLDVLKSVYDDYHSKGFEIYQVAFDVDKTSWARVVKQQDMPWISVCDGLGVNSPYVVTYNVAALPSAYIIADGELVDGQVVDERSLRRLLDKLLK